MELALIAGLSDAEAWPHTAVNGVVVRFPNGYGASIINYEGSYNTELAVIEFKSDGPDSWEIVRDTPITNDVMGWLDRDEVMAILGRIASLPRRQKALTG